jgi:DNA-binding Lrp family transcriptional regulator
MSIEKSNWNLISNHGLVLICLSNYEGCSMRLIGQMIGITERAVQRIVSDLESSGIIKRERVGRKNSYKINGSVSLRNAVSGYCTIEAFTELFKARMEEAESEMNALNHWRIGEHGSEIKFQIKES